MIAVAHLAIACIIAFLVAHVMEHISITHFNMPAADPTKLSATDVALFTFAGAALFIFGILRLFSDDKR